MTSTNPPALQKLRHLDRSSPEFHNQLSNALYGKEYQRCAQNLQHDDMAWLVDYLDKAFEVIEPSSAAFRKCLRELRRICGTHGRLPTSYTLSPHLLNASPEPFAGGGYGDVYKGTLDGSMICIKRLRVYTSDDTQTAIKAFCQEAVVWKRLTHPNILPLLGITTTPPQLVSSWMSGRDLPDYIKKNANADRLGLASDVASGLCYLHHCNVIHGDLKGPNILVDHSGHAVIADFGLAKVTQNLDSIQSTSHQHGHTPRWAAPEVLTKGIYSKEADTFSFAMVMIEVFTGAVPFNGETPHMATLYITLGTRPPRPAHPTFTTELWTLTERCWDQDPRLRPEVLEVSSILCGISTYVASLLGDVQQLVDQIHQHRSRLHVAKKEILRLVNLCDDLTKHLSDGSLVPQRTHCVDIKNNLSRIEERLAHWSRYYWLKRWVKVSRIKSGITDCVGQLASIISQSPIIQPTPVFTPGSQKVSRPNHGTTETVPQRERIGEEVAGVIIEVPEKVVQTPERDTVEHDTQESQPVRTTEPPPVKRLNGEVTRRGELPYAGGTYCEVWIGYWNKGGREEVWREKADPEKVALKALRAPKSSERARNRLERELPHWAGMHHQNILPFHGIVTDLGPRLYMVSPWQENGNLLAYVKQTPGVNKNYLLCGSAAGLGYLHSQGVVHGSVKCKNILISPTGEPQICDFGIAKIIEDSTETTVSKTIAGEAVRYSAPELIQNNNATTTMSSDVYSFAMLILECVTEKIPFHEHSRDAAVIHARISKWQSPPRPDGPSPRDRVSDGLWGLMKQCWNVGPSGRPTMEQIYSFFVLNV